MVMLQAVKLRAVSSPSSHPYLYPVYQTADKLSKRLPGLARSHFAQPLGFS